MNAPSTPRVSIITVNFNNEAGLLKTLDSVQAQTFRDWEHIVIDGGSTDGSIEAIRAREEGISHWVSEPDTGIFNAMNKGLTVAKGEFVQFLNSGDWLWNETVLARVFSGSEPAADLLYGNDMRWSEDKGMHEDRMPAELTPYRFFVSSICHQAVMYRRSLFDELGFYNEGNRIVSDWEFNLRVVLAGKTTRHCDFPMVGYDTTGLSCTDIESRNQERQEVLKRLFAPAVIRDYERLRQLEADCARLKEYEVWTERIRDGGLRVKLSMTGKWLGTKIKNMGSGSKNKGDG